MVCAFAPLGALGGCNGILADGDSGPLAIRSIDPDLGSVAGGTRVTIVGSGLSSSTKIAIGGADCTDVSGDGDRLTCTTGSSDFTEGTVDVVATRGADRATLTSAFTYRCLWTTTAGRRSCGAAPPGVAQEQAVSAWVSQFQPADGFVTDGIANMNDTGDHVLGEQSVWFQTDGTGVPRAIWKIGGSPADFTNADVKIWLKVDGIENVRTLDVVLGDSGLANQFVFSLRSGQGQQWITDGDWVGMAVSWSPENYQVIGAPNRAAITDVMVRAGDFENGPPARIHVNGLAVVPEPVERFPEGVVSFTFDDNFGTMVDPGAAILARYNFPATAYVIVDELGTDNRATLQDLHALADAGWQMSVHANTGIHHRSRYPTLAPDVVEDDMVDARAWLLANGFRGQDHCAYPGGDFTDSVLANAGRYFTSCRTIYRRHHETFPPSDPRKLRVLYVTGGGISRAMALQAIDDARTAREWLVLVFHEIVFGAPASTTQWNVDDFTAVVDHVAATRMPVATVGAVLAP